MTLKAMTEQQGIHDIIAALEHYLTQLERDARKWEAQAREWEAVATAQRAEIARLTLAREEDVLQALIHAARNPSHDHWNDWVRRLRVLADRAALAPEDGTG